MTDSTRRDAVIVEAFVAHLAAHGHPGLLIDCVPERDKPHWPPIDAIAGPFAIEHTSVDALPAQRSHDVWFLEIVEGLEEELSPVMPSRLEVIFPYELQMNGKQRADARSALREWLQRDARDLTPGRYTVQISGIPFRIEVERRAKPPPRLRFWRRPPEDDQFVERVRASFARKAAKLMPYQMEKTTILLVDDSGDYWLMSEHILADAVRIAFGGLPTGVNQLWYADTTWLGDTVAESEILFTDLSADIAAESAGRE